MQLNKNNKENHSEAAPDSWSYRFAPVQERSGEQSGHMEKLHII